MKKGSLPTSRHDMNPDELAPCGPKRERTPYREEEILKRATARVLSRAEHLGSGLCERLRQKPSKPQSRDDLRGRSSQQSQASRCAIPGAVKVTLDLSVVSVRVKGKKVIRPDGSDEDWPPKNLLMKR
jgi:hypothetical protein